MMKNILNSIRGFFKRKRPLSPADIEKILPAEALAALRAEADFLRIAHGVSVRELAAGEKPDKPKAADAAVEAQIKA